MLNKIIAALEVAVRHTFNVFKKVCFYISKRQIGIYNIVL